MLYVGPSPGKQLRPCACGWSKLHPCHGTGVKSWNGNVELLKLFHDWIYYAVKFTHQTYPGHDILGFLVCIWFFTAPLRSEYLQQFANTAICTGWWVMTLCDYFCVLHIRTRNLLVSFLPYRTLLDSDHHRHAGRQASKELDSSLVRNSLLPSPASHNAAAIVYIHSSPTDGPSIQADHARIPAAYSLFSCGGADNSSRGRFIFPSSPKWRKITVLWGSKLHLHGWSLVDGSSVGIHKCPKVNEIFDTPFFLAQVGRSCKPLAWW